MLKKPEACNGCVLNYDWNGFSIPEGTGKNKVLIVGESLGEKEKYHGTPFVRYAEAGSTLELAFRMAKVKREDFGITNLIQCQPPNNKLDNTNYEFPSIEHCRQAHFNRIVNKFKPNVFLALGAVPFKHLTDTHGSIGGILINRGYLFDSIYPNIKLVPSLHPSFINRKLRKHIGVLVRDIKFALDIASGKTFKLDDGHFTDHSATIEEVEDFIRLCKQYPNEPITYDIETSYSKLEAEDIESNQDVRDITQIQFQLGFKKLIVFDYGTEGTYDDNFSYIKTNIWDNPYTKLLIEILQTPNPKAGWNNWLFDSINLEYHLGKGIVKGNNIDLMWAFHHYQPDVKWPGMKLQFVTNIYDSSFPAWKHLATKEPYKYGCYDVHAPAKIYPKLIKDLKNPYFKHKNLHSIDLTSESSTKKTGIVSENVKTLFEGYTDDVVKLWPILRKMSDRGIPIDLVARNEFRLEIKKQIEITDNLIQKLYPFDLRKTEHKEGYKYIPKEVHIYTEEFKNRLGLSNIRNGNVYDNNSNNSNGNSSRFILLLDEDKMQLLVDEYIESKTRKDGMSGLIIRPFKINDVIEYRYDRIETFKPNSSQQLLKYIKAKGHKTGKKKTKEGEWRDTTDKEHIFKLWQDTGDSLYENIILVRELKKMLSTYIGDNDINLYENIEINEDTNEVLNPVEGKQLGWPIGRDSRVHSTFIPEPATGQLSSTRPNVQNTPSKGNQFSSKGYKELAKKFRRIIKASEGKTLMEFDYSGFHALMLGFEAEDETYMRLARLGIHDFIAAYIVKANLPKQLKQLETFLKNNKNHSRYKEAEELYGNLNKSWNFLNDLDNWITLPDNDLKVKLKYIKKNHEFERNAQAKPAAHGIGFGEGVNKLYNLNRHSFANKKQVQDLHDLIKSLFPKVFEYQDKIRLLAHHQHYLVSRFGYIRWFHDVFDWRLIPEGRNPKPGEIIIKGSDNKWWLRTPGKDSEACIAYYPSNNAFGKMKEAMRDCEELEYLDKYGLINQIHDSLMFEIDLDLVDEAARNIKEIMERPSKYLINNTVDDKGLHCNIEIKTGLSWDNMRDYELE